jgi:hypothetical protein
MKMNQVIHLGIVEKFDKKKVFIPQPPPYPPLISHRDTIHDNNNRSPPVRGHVWFDSTGSPCTDFRGDPGGCGIKTFFLSNFSKDTSKYFASSRLTIFTIPLSGHRSR